MIKTPELKELEDWDEKKSLLFEKEVLGMYVSGHPLLEHADEIEEFTSVDFSDSLSLKKNEVVTVGGMVTKITKKYDRRNRAMAFFEMDCFGGTVEVIAFSDCFEKYENLIEEDSYKTYEFKPYFEYEMGSKEGYDEQARRITSLESALGMSKLEGMSNGSYASTLHSLDIATKGYKKHFYNYASSDPKKLNKNKPFSDHTKILDKKLVDLKEGKHYFLSRNTESYPDHVNYHEPNHVTMLKGQGHLSTMNFMTHSFSLPGDFNLTVGKKIKLEFIKAVDLKEFNDPTVPLDKYLGDEYLVTGLVHTLGPEKYTMSLKVQKDSVGRKLGV